MADQKVIPLYDDDHKLKREKVAIVDAGGHLAQVLARKVRELRVYSEVISVDTPLNEYKNKGYKAVLVVGSMADMAPEDVPYPDGFWELDLPILAIGDPALVMAKHKDPEAMYQDEVTTQELEFEADEKTVAGRFVNAHFSGDVKAFDHYESNEEVVVHNFRPLTLGHEGPWDVSCVTSDTLLSRTRTSQSIAVLAYQNEDAKRYALLYHPELSESKDDERLLKRFLVDVAEVNRTWDLQSYIDDTVARLKHVIGDKKALCAFSGGIDSVVASLLVHRAIGQNLTCIFVDTGLMRHNEVAEVEEVFSDNYQMNLKIVDAEDRFLTKLKGVTDPEEKRKIIGTEFIRVFEEEAKALGHVDYLVQGTIYPDVIESGFAGQAKVKSHHNVGGLPEDIGFTGIIEPLRDLFKLEVRRIGSYLGLPDRIVWRQPFPGPGLAVRCLGELTKERLDILRKADAIFREEVYNAGLHRDIQQYFAVLSNVHSVGVRNNARTYEETCVLRAVKTIDFMTANWVHLPYELLDRTAERIIAEVPGINRVAYDITSKPPATIEWE